jgi:NADPH2:quinone reductase
MTLPDTMQAVVATPDADAWTEHRELPVPEPGPGEVLLKISAFAVNRGELSLLPARGEGWRPGQDVAGTIASGAGAGTRVAALLDWHGWAEYALAPDDRVAPIPDGVSDAQAAALPMAGTTALNVVRRGGSILGRRVLITGAAGGVGSYAVRLASLSGAEVTAVSRAGEHGRLRARGAAVTAARVDETEGPFDFILESVGGATLDGALERIAAGGLLVTYGNSTQEPARLDFADFRTHPDARVESFFSFTYEHIAGENLRTLLALVADGRLDPEVGIELPWTRVNEALDAVRGREVAGKAVLTVGDGAAG